ncbi:hypothetical protein FN846DRAFT_891430 [Sphaerosporella brunnea]|uniref:Uncharacterized protein n=1 Tax=Sphaerosporella brunnea TaxID=1250544 RepID=A0A5J5EU65_9PEZI|nr:hypothetical protein FN846DRAFT_891430 [Sphaerosporella brunnea]
MSNGGQLQLLREAGRGVDTTSSEPSSLRDTPSSSHRLSPSLIDTTSSEPSSFLDTPTSSHLLSPSQRLHRLTTDLAFLPTSNNNTPKGAYKHALQMAMLALIIRREHLAPPRGNSKPRILLADLAMSRGWMPDEHPRSPTHHPAHWAWALVALSNDVELSVLWPGLFVGPNQVVEGLRLYVIMTQLISVGFAAINKRRRRPMFVPRPVPGQVALVVPGAPVQPLQQVVAQPVVAQPVQAIHNQQVILMQGLNTRYNRQTGLHRNQFQIAVNPRDLTTRQELIRDDQRLIIEHQDADANIQDRRHEEIKAELKKINAKVAALARQKAN